MDDRKMMEELGERLCDFCPLEDWEKGSHLYPNGYISCEGSKCEDALEHYLEENEMEEDNSNEDNGGWAVFRTRRWGERDYRSDRQKRMRKKLGKTLRTRLKREVKVMIKKEMED